MYLDYSKLEFDADGIPEMPELVLKTMSEDIIGVIPGVFNLKLNIKLSEPSEMTFDVPSVIDGEPNWIYDQLSGHKIIYTKHYGIYLLLNPSTESDGIGETKHIQAYSIEKTLDTKKFFLEEGTFKFYDQTNYKNGDTIMGHIFEIATGWKPGYISPSVAQKYRTFDQYDDYLLSFIYNTAPEKFRCVFVFDPYERTISVYNADKPLCDETVPGSEEHCNLPIYLDFDNLLDKVKIEELSDDLVTAVRPYGADGLDIREVNPIGTNWIYDLSWFIENGDIPKALANKWTQWQHRVLNNRELYRGLSAQRASATLSLLSANAKLTDLNGELDALIAQQSTIIEAQAMETTSTGKTARQNELNTVNGKITAKKAEIAAQKGIVSGFSDDLNRYKQRIDAMVADLDIDNNFTAAELQALKAYFIEQDITEETFVATDLDTGISGQNYTLTNETVTITGSAIVEIPLTDYGKTMYTLTGGRFQFSGSHPITGDIIRGTLERKNDNSYVLSLYAGSLLVNNATSPSGCITMSGTMSGFSNNIHPVTVDGITMNEGSSVSFSSASGALYLTANVSEYKKYCVGLELYDFAADLLRDLATPTFEFSVDSGNFIFANEFAPFRNRLELGKGVYLNIGGAQPITPYIIEFELTFEDRSSFSIVFSNRFKRHDEVNTLKDMIEKSYSSGRSFDASKYIYNQVTNQQAAVSRFMSSSLDAAKNTILAAANNSVRISGAGIQVGGDSKYQLRIVDRMIAITDDNWSHAKLAIGLFKSDEVGEYFGVNAEVIGGKLIVGNNLVIENENDNGVMQFKVDSSGAWLNNSTFVLQKDSGGKIIIDPAYGIVAGNGNLYTTSGTTVTPSFIKSDKSIDKDTDGMPKNSNFYLDIANGDAYFRGKLLATSGKLGGFTIESSYLYSGTGSNRVAVNGGTDYYSLYAFWAGAENPANAPFWVKKNGEMKATNCTITGVLNASTIRGTLTAETGGELVGPAIYVPTKTAPKFKVDSSGNVTMSGNISMTGNITWGTNNSPVRVLYARSALDAPVNSYASYPDSSSYNWHKTMSPVYDYYASYSYDGGQTWTGAVKIHGTDGRNGRDGVDGSDATVNERNVFNVLTNGGTKFGIFNDSTTNRLYINANYIRSGTIDADIVTLGSTWGGFSCALGYDGVRTTYGAKMYGSDSDMYFIATNRGVRMQAGSNSFFVTDGGVYSDDEITIRSDKRLKNTISYDMDKYGEFFMRLKPSFFRMNNGASGRFHIGFIAQDVETAIIESGLSTDDFSGLVQSKRAYDPGELDGQYYLRYTNFISLNTFMIQKLYRRIDELERRIENMS